MSFRLALISLLTLSACCPVPLQSTPTAFRGTVIGVSPEVSALRLEPRPGGPPVSFIAPPNTLRSSNGDALPVTAIQVGDEVYVRGTMQNGELQAELVQRLE